MMSRENMTIRRLHRRTLQAALIAVSLAMATSSATAKETAKDRYNFDIACLAISGAASSLPALYMKERSDAVTMQQLYAKRLTASAAAVHIPSARARAEAEEDRRGFVASFHTNSNRASAAAENELVQNLERCEALPVFEVIDRVKR